MSVLKALGSGLAGACVLTLVHETVRRLVPDAPRMDVLGMRAIKRTMRGIGETPPAADELRHMALAGDVVGNGLYYSLVALGGKENAWRAGALLGLGAGIGAILLPAPLGLGAGPSARTPQTQAMTVAWYLAGGLAAAAAYRLLPADAE